MNFTSVSALFNRLSPPARQLSIGKNNYPIVESPQTFQLLDDDCNVSTITYMGFEFTLDACLDYAFADLIFEGVHSQEEEDKTVFWIQISSVQSPNKEIRATLIASKNDAKYQALRERSAPELLASASFVGTRQCELSQEEAQFLIGPGARAGLTTVSFTHVSVPPGTPFWNVSGSTKDPHPTKKGDTWLGLWEHSFNRVAQSCESYDPSICVNANNVAKGLVGGHVFFQGSKYVPIGGDCYLTPICRGHNGSEDINMQSLGTHYFLHMFGFLQHPASSSTVMTIEEENTKQNEEDKQ